MHPRLQARLGAEFVGTFWLVFGGCGAAIFDAAVPDLGIGYLGVALAFGLTVLTGVYAFGHVSGAHFNPAVTVGLAVGRRFPWKDVPAYIATQIVAATAAGAVLLVIASGKAGFSAHDGFATNGYGDHSPQGYGLLACAVIEIVLTAMFVYVIMGSTDGRAPKGFAGLAIGLSLTLIHLIAIPVTNTSVNPARSLGVAWYAGSGPLGQVWLFIVAPIAGATLAGLTYHIITGVNRAGIEIAGD